MASNDTLSMLDEMQTFGHMFPRMSAQELLDLATVNGAKALNQPREAGTIGVRGLGRPDRRADGWHGGDPYEAIVYADKQVSFSMVGGEVIFDETQ